MLSLLDYVSTDYLKAAARLFAPIKQHSYEKMNIAMGHQVLDIGCGPGIDVIALGGLVGGQGQVIGLDCDAKMLADAQQRVLEAGLYKQVHFVMADVTTLPLANDQFDSCRSERLFMHLQRVGLALQEIIRVTKPGGYIVSIETDWATLSCNSDHIDTERRLVRCHAERFLNNGYAARHLYGQFSAAGLKNIELEIFPLHTTDVQLYRSMTMMDKAEQHALYTGMITPSELETWYSELEQKHAQGRFFASINVITAWARKPW